MAIRSEQDFIKAISKDFNIKDSRIVTKGNETYQARDLTAFFKRMENYAERLKRAVQRQIDGYYDSYSPKVYDRKDWFRKSLEMNIKKTNNNIEIVIGFNNKYAWHPSIIKKYRDTNRYRGYVPILLDMGWEWKSMPPKIKHRFHWYEGYSFMEEAIQSVAQYKPTGLEVNLVAQYEGEIIKWLKYT